MARAYTNLASVSVYLRRLGAARRHLRAGLEYCAERALDSWRLYMTGWLAVCEFWEGGYAAAAAAADEMLRYPRLAVARIQPLLVLGRVRARRGDPQASEVLDEAWALASDTGELQRVGPVAAGRGEAAWLAGDLARVQDAARSAFDLVVERDDSWMLGELGFWLWRAGVLRGSPRGAAEPYALTAREVEVLRLVAEGLRNAEIAERLFVSPKTIGHHVSSLLGQLGARSRSQAAGRAAEILGATADPERAI